MNTNQTHLPARHRRLRTAGAASATAAMLLAALAGGASPSAADTSPDPWVYSWGPNGSGELGNGSTVALQTPGPVQGLARQDVKQLAAGGNGATGPFAVALLKNGTLKSWGDNTQGQLADGTVKGRSFPAAVVGLSGVQALAVGCNHALVLKNGRVWAWGRNDSGQLGDGTTSAKDTGTPKPVAVQGLDKVKAVAAGCHFSMALRQDGTVWTWGSNDKGQLGLGGTANRSTPQQVPGLAEVIALAPGSYHGAVLTAGRTVKAWGLNSSGQLGNDSTVDSGTPVDVKYLEGVEKLVAGSSHHVAVLSDGSVKGWGRNTEYELADGTTVNRTTPVPIEGLNNVRDIAAGNLHTVAVREDQSVIGWGYNYNGQLGDGTTTTAVKPVTVLPAGSGVNRVAAGSAGNGTFAY
ncbi:RCC1 domain-containing protein [Streptomyces sp. NPDC058290]|uniref:RCC1 domain-containing protein n=1 Tax=Streptomyces sp. NPDC058290 TaxID=3346426 RepID=UPI0036EBE3AA